MLSPLKQRVNFSMDCNSNKALLNIQAKGALIETKPPLKRAVTILLLFLKPSLTQCNRQNKHYFYRFRTFVM